MKFSYSVLLLTFIVFFASSCANYQLNYSKNGKEWESVKLPANKKPAHSIYLIGDAGNSPEGGLSPVLSALKEHLEAEDENSSIIFLGDNIYPSGMPPKGDETRPLAEHRLMSQLKILDNFKGTPYFIPGNHDWWKQGKKGLRRQEKMVENYLNAKRGITDSDDKNWGNYFLPDRGCSGPSIVEVNDQLVIIFVDSQWWMKDWDKEPRINDGCDAVSRQKFQFLFENAVRKHRTKNVVVAMHHPNETYGPHGGGFSFKDHMKPVPILGSIVVGLRTLIGHNTDKSHRNYRAFNTAINASVGKNGSYILAAGHEHNLQYITKNKQHYIVSGSGSKVSAAKLGAGSEFAYGGSGFSKLYFYEDGTAYTEFYKVEKGNPNAVLVFRKKIKDKLQNIEENIPKTYPEFEEENKIVSSKVTKMNIKKAGTVQKFFLGDHFRDIYTETYDFPTLNMDTKFGGLTPVKQGGGNQTNSLRVRSADTGRDYVLRGMTKDATRFIPYPFNKMDATKFLVEETFLSTHPFAPLIMPDLSDAINIYHTNPKLYYVPGQPKLKYYNEVFSKSIHLLEERPGGKKWKNSGVFGNPDKLIGTPDLIENLEKNKKHQVDQKFTLRSRLFDIIIGDWDRHEDQWRWAAFKQDDETVLYRPVPRDRDQAFSKYDGLLVAFSRMTMPFLKSLRVYNPKIKGLKWLIWSGRHFDHSFIHELSWSDWEEQIKFIQTNLTDEVIESAVKNMPEKAQELSADHIATSIKTRRDDLMKYARKYYKYTSELVEILGTNDSDIFEIERLPDGKVRVQAFDEKKGKKGVKFYDRVFDHKITKEIDIYGQGDDDRFEVYGVSKKSIKVRLIGGLGKDTFEDKSKVSGISKKTKIYDNFEKNTLKLGSESADKRDRRREYNMYNRRGLQHEFNLLFPFFWGGFNPDEGVYLGGQIRKTNYGFKKSPYSSSYFFGVRAATSTGALNATFVSDFIDIFHKWDFYTEVSAQTPTFVLNYYGTGNESTIDRAFDQDYWRVKQSNLKLAVALKNTFLGNSGFYAFGPLFEIAKVDNTESRFLGSAEAGIPDFTYDTKYFGGAMGKFDFENVDNIFIPKNGFKLNFRGEFLNNISENNSYSIGVLESSMTIYRSIDKNEHLVLATRIGGGRVVGDRAEFFSMPNIGGNNGLRGYSNNRFYGRASFYHNTELRWRIVESINATLPFSFGLFGGADYGRVWEKEDESKKWHYNYGGGIWIAPVNALNLSAGLFIPEQSESKTPRLSINLGFGF